MVTQSGVTTEERFQDRLRRLVTEAAANGVDVEGSWPVVDDDGEGLDWDVEIVQLARSRTE